MTTADHRRIDLVPGFRDEVLRARPSRTPRPDWTPADYDRVAGSRVVAARRRLEGICAVIGAPGPFRLLEIGCGAGLESTVAALDGVGSVLAVDRSPAVTDPGERGDRARRLLGAALRAAGSDLDVDGALRTLPLEIRELDATSLPLADDSVDVAWSRAVLEHVQPLEAGLRELARVVRPGGLAHHVIDPFFWLKGCHGGGLTDVPWGHARLAPDDFARAAVLAEGTRRGERRAAFLATLNPLGLDGWRSALLDSGPWELVSWEPKESPVARSLLAMHPEVPTSLLPAVTPADLVCQSITAVLRLGDTSTPQDGA